MEAATAVVMIVVVQWRGAEWQREPGGACRGGACMEGLQSIHTIVLCARTALAKCCA